MVYLELQFILIYDINSLTGDVSAAAPMLEVLLVAFDVVVLLLLLPLRAALRAELRAATVLDGGEQEGAVLPVHEVARAEEQGGDAAGGRDGAGLHVLLPLGDGAVDAVQRQQGHGPGGEEVQPQRLPLLRVQRHHLQEAHQGAQGAGE